MLMHDPQGVLVACDQALKYDPFHIKSLLRRARIYGGMNDYEPALIDLKVIKLLQPHNKEMIILWNHLLAHKRAYDQKLGQLMKNAI